MDERIESETSKAYFSQLPHIIFDYDLSHTEFKLWCYYNRVGNCWQSVETTAKGVGISVGGVSEARRKLEAKGLIKVAANQHGTSTIRVKDLWPENMAKYASPSKNDAPSKNEGKVSGIETSPSENETKNNPLKNNPEEEWTPPPPDKTRKLAPHEERMLARENMFSPSTPPEIKALYQALSEVTQSRNDKSLQETAYQLLRDNVTPSEVLTLYGGSNCYWRRVDWRGQKGNRPELGNITGTIIAAREWLTNGGAAETEKATEAAQLYRQWIQPLAGMNGTAREYFKAAPSQVKRVLSANGMGNIDQIKRVSEADFAGWYAGVK
jgi:hypothetical protein